MRADQRTPRPLFRPGRVVGAALVVGLAATAVSLVGSPQAQAAPGFTGGDVVVYRVGSGAALTNAAAPVFLDEFGPTGGQPKQTIALPTSAADGNLPLTAAGQSRSEGLLTRSPDGHYLALTGYGAAVGATGPGGISLTGSDPADVKRVVGIVDGHGGVDTSTALADSHAPQIVRSALTLDGDQILAAGGDGGLLATSLNNPATTVDAGKAESNLGAVTSQAGALFTSGILADRLSEVNADGTLTALPGLPDNLLTYGYAVLDLTSAGWNGTAADTVYLADASNRAGTVDKYRFDGTTWTRVGYVDVPGVTGLVADVKNGAASLAVTTPTSLLSLTDTAAAGTSFDPAAPTTLATAPTGTEFRGVALAPTAATAGPSAFVRSPLRGATLDLTAASVPVSAYLPTSGTVSAVRATLTSGSTTSSAAATRGTGSSLWSATVPTAGLAAGAGTLTITATDADGTSTVTRAVTLSGTSAPVVPANALTAGKHAPSEAKVKRTGTWAAYATSLSPTKKGLQAAKKNAALTTSVYGGKFVVTFTSGPKAGKATVTVDGKSVAVDTYAKKAGAVSKTYRFTGALKAHSVKVTVAGAKSKKSKGTTVSVAVLTVS